MNDFSEQLIELKKQYNLVELCCYGDEEWVIVCSDNGLDECCEGYGKTPLEAIDKMVVIGDANLAKDKRR